ncbi:MAG: C40 family peptidase [Cyanobacteria bacterium P01_A01_bin.45]
MVSFEQLQASTEYECLADLNLYDSPECTSLATQAAIGRHLRVIKENSHEAENTAETAVKVCLCEDDYPGWISISDLNLLNTTDSNYQAQQITAEEIQKRIPDAIAFTQKAMEVPNYYLWGGTVAPNYDCSGLMQAAFASVGVRLPRDAYQQEAFLQSINLSELQPGDLVFFGNPQKATHVGLYLGENSYIHSSGTQIGRNGIGIDLLSEQGDKVSQSYYKQLRGAGRIVQSYVPQALLTREV